MKAMQTEPTPTPAAETAGSASRPKLVCLCGSLRFKDEFERQEMAHLMRGEIALLPCCMHVDIQRVHGEMSDYKARADARHKELIALADEVLVLNVGGYVGDSTAREIFHAKRLGKPIKWLEPQCLCRKCGTPVDYIGDGAVLVCFSCFDAFLSVPVGEQNDQGHEPLRHPTGEGEA